MRFGPSAGCLDDELKAILEKQLNNRRQSGKFSSYVFPGKSGEEPIRYFRRSWISGCNRAGMAGKLFHGKTECLKTDAPGVTRTRGTEIRNLVLYPPELRGRKDLHYSKLLIVTVFVTIWASRYSCCLCAASLRSESLTMLYRSKTALVLCPLIIIATLSGIPERTMLRTAVLLKSWKTFIPVPAFLQAVFHAL